MNTLFVIACLVLIVGSRVVEHYQVKRGRARLAALDECIRRWDKR